MSEIVNEATREYRVAKGWADQMLGTPNVATIWIPENGFYEAERGGENFSITRTIAANSNSNSNSNANADSETNEAKRSDSAQKYYGIGIGDNPIINSLWDSFSIPRNAKLPHGSAFEVTGEWEAYFVDTSEGSQFTRNILHSDYLVNLNDSDAIGVTEFLLAHAPTSSTFPGSDEVRAWITLRGASGSLAAVAAIAEWESGGKILSSVAVDSSLRGKGLGALLMSECMNAAKTLAIPSLVLAVLSANEAAVKLYQSAGWALMERFSHYERI